MAKKRPTPTKNRLKRFGKWSDAHRADILEELGLSEQDFRALSRGEKKTTLNRGLSLDKQSKDPAYTAAPQSIEQLRAAAGNAGQLQYGRAQSQLGQYGQAIDPWFQDYVTRTQQIQGQQQAMAAPVIQQAQTNAQQAGQTVLNADPNSEAGQNDALAAASRKALGDAFATMLGGQQAATNTYYANQAGAAEAARVGEHRTQGQSMQDLLRERGAFETDYLTDARDREHTKGLERKAFGLKVEEAQADVQTERTKIRQDARDKQRDRRDKRKADRADTQKERADYIAEHGIAPEKVADGLTPAERNQMRDHEAGAAEPVKEDKKAKTDLRKAVSRLQGKLNGKKTAPDTFWKQAYEAFVNEMDMDPALARAAVQLVRLGKVGPNTRKTLQDDYGLTDFPKGTKRKKPAPYTLPKRPVAPNRDRQPG